MRRARRADTRRTHLQIDPRKPRKFSDIKKHDDALHAANDVDRNTAANSIFNAGCEAHYVAVKLAVHDPVSRAMGGNPNDEAMQARMDADFFGKIKDIYFPLAHFGDFLVQVTCAAPATPA